MKERGTVERKDERGTKEEWVGGERREERGEKSERREREFLSPIFDIGPGGSSVNVVPSGVVAFNLHRKRDATTRAVAAPRRSVRQCAPPHVVQRCAIVVAVVSVSVPLVYGCSARRPALT